MADTIVRTFSLLKTTDEMLEELTKLTFRRNKGDVIDWLVAEKFADATLAQGGITVLRTLRPEPAQPEPAAE